MFGVITLIFIISIFFIVKEMNTQMYEDCIKQNGTWLEIQDGRLKGKMCMIDGKILNYTGLLGAKDEN
jgi:hypothetical protein